MRLCKLLIVFFLVVFAVLLTWNWRETLIWMGTGAASLAVAYLIVSGPVKTVK